MDEGDYGQLKEVLHRFFKGDASLSEQLYRLQTEPPAWTWASWLLQRESDPQLRFFAATTLSAKIARDFGTLSPQEALTLKSSLLDWLHDSGRNGWSGTAAEKPVFRKLAVAVCNLSLKLHNTNAWPNWTLELVAYLSAASSNRPAPSKEALYELLLIIAEQSTSLRLAGKDKVTYERTIWDTNQYVCTTLAQTFQSSVENSSFAATSTSLLNAALKCCQAWISASQMSQPVLEQLYPFLLYHWATPSCHNVLPATSACLDEWMSQVSSFFTQKRLDDLLDVMTLPWIPKYIQGAQTGDVDEETVQAVAKLLISTVEFSTATLVDQITSERSMTIFNNLLLMTSYPGVPGDDDLLSNSTFTSWGLVQEEMAEKGCIGSDPNNRGQVVGKDLFKALAGVLRKKIMWPEDASRLAKDAIEHFQYYRRDAGDVILNAYYVLREPLSQELVELAQSSVIARVDSRDIEATLFCLKSIAEGVPEDGASLTGLINAGFLNALPTDGQTRKTMLALIGELAEWARSHQETILPAVSYIVAALQVIELSQPAARTLRLLCDSCRKELTPYYNDFAGLVHSLAGRIPSDDYVKVMASVAAVLQALPVEQALEPMLNLCEAPIQGLQQALEFPQRELPEEMLDLVTTQLDCLSACAKGFARPDQEVLDLDELIEATEQAQSSSNDDVFGADARVQLLRQLLMQNLRQLVTKFGANASIISSIVELAKAITRSSNATPLYIHPVHVLELFSTTVRRGDPPMWLSGAAVLVYRFMLREKLLTSQDLVNRFALSLQTICQTICGMCSSVSEMNANPDVVQSFMQFLSECFKHAMPVFSQMQDCVAGTLAFSCLALQMQERVALQRVSEAFSLLVTDGAKNEQSGPLIIPVVLQYGAEMVKTLVSAIALNAPRSSVPALTELLFAFTTGYPEQTRLWTAQAFGEPDFPSPRLTQEAKDRFLKVMASCRTLKRLNNETAAFALKGRGLEATAF